MAACPAESASAEGNSSGGDLLIRLNMYWLLLIVIIPFTTSTLSGGQPNLLRFGLYAATQATQFAIFAVIIVLILRMQLAPAATDVELLRGGLWQTMAWR